MSEYQPTPPPSPYGGPEVPANERWNVLAIVAFVLAFVVSIGGIICGHIALSQIRRTGEKGRGLALAGTILGYVFTILGVLTIIAVFVLFVVLANSGFSTSP